MNRIVFKNIPSKSWIRNVVEDRINHLEGKYPELTRHQCSVTLECRNSSAQAGPDEYAVTLHLSGPRHKKIRLTKCSENLLKSLATAVERMDELIGKSREYRRKAA